MAGQNGGGIFVLFYLIFLIAMGLPVLTMELAVGRASRKSAVLGYNALEKPNSKWHIQGWVAIFGCYMLMMYYTTVSGWMVTYFYKFVKGEFTPRMDTEQTGAVFSNLLADPKQMAFWMILTVVVGFFVCSRGLQNGLEKISKVMMSALLILIIVLAVHSLTLSGAGEGLKFYLVPNMDSVREVGLKNVITSAMNQAFFTLEPWRGSNGDFRKLHGKRPYAGRRRNTYLRTGYLCGDYGRIDYFSGMLQLWRGSRRRTKPYLCDTAKCLCKYGWRQNLGRTVLPVHDICKLFYGNCRI